MELKLSEKEKLEKKKRGGVKEWERWRGGKKRRGIFREEII